MIKHKVIDLKLTRDNIDDLIVLFLCNYFFCVSVKYLHSCYLVRVQSDSLLYGLLEFNARLDFRSGRMSS